ncbi:unnamed protein product [Paramecium primaurelia]|uniref:Uncharacterized protein n=1 Tax=Paramecium primaurelia TaxID=5886 RepID=A0A8S1KWU2_PARPR|nr:unnamed protein product [Paramecium primaurelia]
MNFTQKKLYLFNQINYQGQEQKIIQNQQCMESQSFFFVKFQPLTSTIKVIYINSNLNNNNSKYVYFYSQCNYQGTIYQIQQGQQLDRSNKIPFEIKFKYYCKIERPIIFWGLQQSIQIFIGLFKQVQISCTEHQIKLKNIRSLYINYFIKISNYPVRKICLN